MNDNIENNNHPVIPTNKFDLVNNTDSGIAVALPPVQPMTTEMPNEVTVPSHSAHKNVYKGEAYAQTVEADTPVRQASAVAASIPVAPAAIDDPKEYPLAPFSLNKDEMEHIGLNSGNLALTVTDFTLPGKNGFDLTLTRRYNSSMSNESELTPKFVKEARYTWNIDFTCRCKDLETNQTVTVDCNIYDTIGQYATKADALDAAEAAWEYWADIEYYKGNIIEVFFYDEFEYHDCEILLIFGKSVSTAYKAMDSVVSDTRPNDHLNNTYGLGLGWGLGFPSIEVVGELFKKDRVRYYNFLHLGDGQVYKLEGSTLKDYKLQDITFSGSSGSIGGKQYHYVLSYKDGRKAYFNKESQDSIRLIAMTDRFNNTIYFNLSSNGGSITDTLGRTIYLSRTAVMGGYTLTWTLPDNGKVEYTVQNGLLAKVKDQAGCVTTYGYENYPGDWGNIFRKGYVFRSYKSWEFGDDGVNIPYRPLTDITYPTGATSKYIYEFFDYAQGGTLQGTQGMLLIRRCVDYENTGAYKNLRDYWYDTAWKTMDSEYDQRLYIKFARVTTDYKVDEYDFAYQKPVSKQITKVGGVIARERSIPSYAYDQLPTKEVVKRIQNGKTLTSESTWSYDVKGNMLTETLPVRGTGTMTYDGSYSLPLSRVYKKDSNTEIQEVYTLRSDNKVVEWKKVYEKIGSTNPVLKEVTQYTYDASNNLVAERRYSNLSLTVSSVDQVTTYSYINTNSQLNSATYNDVYLTEKRISGVKNVDGAVLADVVEGYVCDVHGRVLKKTDPCGKITSFNYDGMGRVTKESYVDGMSKEFQYVVSASVNYIAETEKGSNGAFVRGKRMEYTSLGKIARVYALTPDTCLSYYTYDTLNRLSYEYTYGTDGTTYTFYSYDAFDRVLTKTTNGPNLPSGYQEVYSYDDAFDTVRQYVKETREVVGSGSAAPSIIFSVLKDVLGRTMEETTGNSTIINTYDFAGNKTSHTDPRTGAICVQWVYDHAGRVKSEIRYTDTGTVTSDTEYDALGNKKTFTDFRRKQTQFAYDVLGRLLEQKTDFSGPDKAITRYYYDAVGNITNQKVLSAGGVYRETGYTYDSRYRLIDTIMNNDKTETRSRFEYDAAGDKTAMYTGMLGASTSGAAKTTYTYDRFGNMKTMTDPVGNSPNPSDPARRTETYTYDNYGQLRQKKDRNGFVTVFKYDGMGKVLREDVTDSDGDVPDNYRAFSYHKNGMKAAEENGELSVSFTYDNMGRLISQSESCRQGAANNIVKSYGYDQCGNRKSFIMSKDGVHQISLTYDYDKQNRLKEVLRNGVKIAVYTYDPNGNRASLTYPQSGLVVSYVYNDANLVTDLYNKKDGVHRSSYHYAYSIDGNQSRKTAKLSSKPDQVTDYQYDRLGRLTEEKEQGGSKLQYTYDRFSNRLKMTVTDANNKVTTTDYEYDLRNRLQAETKTYDGTEEILHYRYDFNGNQIYREWEKFSPKKEKKTPGKVGFTSDKFKEDIVILEMREYNGFNQLTYLYRDAYETRYSYRPDGLRLKKHFADSTTLSHIFDGQNIVAEYNANGSINARYLRGVNLIARDQDNLLQYFIFNAHALNAETPQNEIMVSTGQGATARQVGVESLEYYIFNAHGDVTGLTNASGDPIKSYDYDAFGNQRKPDPKDTNPFRFCAEYWDSDTETLYLRNRHYSPYNGHFTQEDPIRDGLNWYAYCAGNPIAFVDPLGLKLEIQRGDPAKWNWKDTYEYLQSLTSDSLTYSYDKSRGAFLITITPDGRVKNPELAHGTNLVRGLIDNDKHYTTIKRGNNGADYDYGDNSGAYKEGVGTGVTVEFNPYKKRVNYLSINNKTGAMENVDRNPMFGLVHELIHADRAMLGKAIPIDQVATHTYYLGGPSFIGPQIPYIESGLAEDFATVGLTYDSTYTAPAYGISENLIRAEHGAWLRGTYMPFEAAKPKR